MNLYLTRAGRLRRQDNTLRFETVSLPPEEEHADPETESGELDEKAADEIKKQGIELILC